MSKGSLLPTAELAIDRRGLFTRDARLALSCITLALLTGIPDAQERADLIAYLKKATAEALTP